MHRYTLCIPSSCQCVEPGSIFPMACRDHQAAVRPCSLCFSRLDTKPVHPASPRRASAAAPDHPGGLRWACFGLLMPFSYWAGPNWLQLSQKPTNEHWADGDNGLLAVLLFLQPRMLLPFFAARACCWLTVSSPASGTSGLSCRAAPQPVPSLCHCKELGLLLVMRGIFAWKMTSAEL